MGERDHRHAVELVGAADAGGEARDSEQLPDREPSHRDDQLRTQEPKLPVPPERAELLFARRRRPVAATGPCAPWVASGDGRAVERRVELLLVEVQPAPKRATCAASPRSALLSLDGPGCLAVHERGLIEAIVADRPRLERIARVHARAA